MSGPSGIDWGAWPVEAPGLGPACVRRAGALGLRLGGGDFLSPKVELPGPTSKNTGRPVRLEFQINSG